MKKIILSVLIIISLLPMISAGYISINPNPVNGGNNVTVTMYATPNDPMDCGGVVLVRGKTTVVGYVGFDCGLHCRCYSTVNTTFFASESLKGEYEVSVWDYISDNFLYGYFTVIENKCANNVKDINETDIDCGGDKCNKCSMEKNCLKNSDCQSDYCDTDKKCRVFESKKNLDKYSTKEVFIVSDENYQDVLKLVSLSNWNENNKSLKYPVLIYHNESNAFDFDSGIHFLQLYSPSHVTIFGESPKKLDKLLITNNDKTQAAIQDNAGNYLGVGLSDEQITKISSNDYYSYWNNISEVVVCPNDYETGLMASVYASYKNAPLMFENEISYGVLSGKKAIIVGNIKNKTLNNIKNITSQTIIYSNLELQKEYINLTKTDKLILVNTNDFDIEINKSFRTDKSSKINQLYSKNSLAAAFLAAQRQELIISVQANDSGDNSNCKNNTKLNDNFDKINSSLKKQIENLNWTFKYLTIISSPNSIPDSTYNFCDLGKQFRNVVDKDYANLTNNSMEYGRIYGISVADTSSYIARDVFYEKLKENLYGSYSSGISIGHSIVTHINNTVKIHNSSQNSDYDSVCYTGEARDGCTNSYKVPLEDYSKRQFIIFGDHGLSSAWYDTLNSDKVPALDLSYVFSHACLTNNFWEGKEKLMSAKMIRKGAMSYQGAAGLSYVDSSELGAIKKLTSADISLGELNNQVGEDYNFYKTTYLMLGDPLLKLNLKEINWDDTTSNNSENQSEFESPIPGFSGQISSITSEKSTYQPNDKIIINTIVQNENNFPETLYIEYSIGSEDGSYISEFELNKIELEENSSKEFNYSMDVSPTMPAGTYKSKARLLNGDIDIDEKEIEFNVSGTSKEMEVFLISCDDVYCNQESKVFDKNQTIYLNFENSIDANLQASLVYPDSSEKTISLPYAFSTDKFGNYKLLANFSKQGYLDLHEEMIFGVVDNPNISTQETCNLDKICNNLENIQNCPQDCIFVNISSDDDFNNGTNDTSNNNTNNNSTTNNTAINNTDYIDDNHDNFNQNYHQDFYDEDYLHINQVSNNYSIMLNDTNLQGIIKLNPVNENKENKRKTNPNEIILIIFIFMIIYLILMILLVIVSRSRRNQKKKRGIKRK